MEALDRAIIVYKYGRSDEREDALHRMRTILFPEPPFWKAVHAGSYAGVALILLVLSIVGAHLAHRSGTQDFEILSFWWFIGSAITGLGGAFCGYMTVCQILELVDICIMRRTATDLRVKYHFERNQ